MSQPPETRVTDHIALEPSDWQLATWRPRTPHPRPTPAPFDQAACLDRLRALSPLYHDRYYPPNWQRHGLSAIVSPEEAHFWFLAMTHPVVRAGDSDVLTTMTRTAITGHITPSEVFQRLRQFTHYFPPIVVALLAALFPSEQLIELLLDEQLHSLDAAQLPYHHFASLQVGLIDGFRDHVLPYLTDSNLERMREVVRARVPASRWTQGLAPSIEWMMAYRLAPLLRLHRELELLVTSWPDNLFPLRGGYEEWRRQPRQMIFGLGSAWLVEQHIRRLRLYLRSEEDARAWLAHTEMNGIDWLIQSIRLSSSAAAQRLIEVLCRVHSPVVVPTLVQLRLEGRACATVRSWFVSQVGNAVAGLLPLASGRGRVAQEALTLLKEIHWRGQTDTLTEQLEQAAPGVVRRVRQILLEETEPAWPTLLDEETPPWLYQALCHLTTRPRQDLPDWMILEDLPPLVIQGRRLGPTLVRTVLHSVETCTLDAPDRLLTELRLHVEERFRERFVLRVLTDWQRVGSPSHVQWILKVAGFLGDNAAVSWLAAMLRDCTGRAMRRLTVVVLENLAAIGSALALQHLFALSRTASNRQIREHARRFIDQIARQRGQSRGELEDLGVPSLGFTDGRGPEFDFGARSFQAILAPGPRLLLRGSDGTVREALPAPCTRDDPARARRATLEWRQLRQTLRAVIKEQAIRLEQGMISGHRWAVRHFRERVLLHPLLAQLARSILWGGYNDRGRLSCTFRVTDEGTFLDADENAVSLRDINSIRVVHPIEMSDEARQAWEVAWRDHELIPPFPQLGRKLYRLSDDERHARAITAYRDRRIPALSLTGHLHGQDWERGTLLGSRHGEVHLKRFRAVGLVAVLHHRNVGSHVYPDHRARQELHALYFFSEAEPRSEPFDPARALPLAEVPPLIFSEVHEVMAFLYRRGTP